MDRRNFLLGLGILGALGPRVANSVVKNSLPPEGAGLFYQLIFGDSVIGSQRIKIRSHDDKDHVIVDHEVDMEVRVLFTVAYSLKHRSTEVWNGYNLISIDSETKENNQNHVIKGNATHGDFVLHNENGALDVRGNVVTLDSFWLASAMSTPKLINTRNGDIAIPKSKSLGNGRWHLKADFPHGPIEATMKFNGDFLEQAEIDSAGHIVKIKRMNHSN